MKMDQKLKGKFKDKIDTFRVIPNQITSRRDQEALNQQIEEFNTSKIMPNSNPEQPEYPEEMNSPLQRSNHQHPHQYQSAVEINQKPYLEHRYQPQHHHQPHPPLYNQSMIESPSQQSRVHYQNGPQSRESNDRRLSPEQYNQMYRLPYASRNPQSPSVVSNQRKHANLTDSYETSEMHPIRNYLPDQLEGFLRDQSKSIQRRRPMQPSLSKDRMKI